MRGFFKGKLFKMMAIVMAVLVVIGVVFTLMRGYAAPQSSAAGAVTSPLQAFMVGLSEHWRSFSGVYSERDRLKRDNEALQKQVNELTDKQIDYDTAMAENEEYKKYLGLKEEHPDFEMVPAMVISHDAGDPFFTMLIDKGSIAGVSRYDPVVTDEGVVGYVSEVGPTYAKIMTILNPALELGGMDSRTRDVGSVGGSAAHIDRRLIQMTNLRRDSAVAVGDNIITYSLAGVFPKGLKIGTVAEIHQAESDVSVQVIVRPFVEFDKLRSLMVITGFAGQGDITLAPQE